MESTETKRKLQPAYKFMGNTLAWRCDQCAKMFYLNNTREASAEIVMPHILAEFRNHSCSGARAVPPTLPERDDFGGAVIMIDRNALLSDKSSGRE